MKIRIGFEIAYRLPQATPMILALNVHHSRVGDLRRPDHLMTSPSVTTSGYRDLFGNWCTRLVAPAGRFVVSSDTMIHDSGVPDTVAATLQQIHVERLPESTLVYLLGSRYCETDLLSDFAWKQFGNGPTGWQRVQAVCDYVHRHIEFGYQHARRTRSAFEAFNEGRGVCRDYAHLAITLCRCLNIPARYCTGYLGDIGVPPPDGPMDFAGWFEAFLGDDWYTFDARNNVPRIGRVLMARGRDASDVALSNTFGPNDLDGFKVWCDEVH
ncbi:transglutaminase family protein [Pelomonas sp. KK5]|uniref:transglutaminase-like domain-containing protein n=1 Tax=Pelomonas sp. KK5 TaxID=1855730 RepID=UPI00097BFFA4|nr:transglutaminase family protein [Pelomonas sp. KK5]